DSENSLTIFEVKSSDEESTLENNRFTKANEYHAIPHPITGNPLTPRADISFAGLNEYAFRNKIIKSKTTKTNKTVGTTNEASIVKPKYVNETVVSKSKVNRDEVIIEDWTSDDKDDVCADKTVSSVNVTQAVRSQADKSGQTSQKLGLWYPRDSPFELEAFSDSDYAGASLDRKSTTGGCQFLGKRLISWQCTKQTIMANSTTEAEYVAAAHCCRQVLCIQNQMMDYGFNFMNTKIHIDNESTICVVKNPVYHSRTKHIEIRYHFIRDCYEKRLIDVLKIHTDSNVADLLTKGFDVTRIRFSILTISIHQRVHMANLKYSDKHNMVAFLKKPNESVGFTEVVDFLKGTSLRGSLWFMVKVSAQPAEPHNTHVDPIPSHIQSTSLTLPFTTSSIQLNNINHHLIPPLHHSTIFIHLQHSPTIIHTHGHIEALSPEGNTSGSAEDSCNSKNLMNLRIRGEVSDIDDEPLFVSFGKGIHERDVNRIFVYSYKSLQGRTQEKKKSSYNLGAAKTFVKRSSSNECAFGFVGVLTHTAIRVGWFMNERGVGSKLRLRQLTGWICGVVSTTVGCVLVSWFITTTGRYLAPTLTKKLFANMKKGFARDIVPLLPAMLAGADVDQGNTSGSAKDSMQLKELMVLVPKLVTRINSLEKELKDTKQTLGNAMLKLVQKVKTLETTLKRKSKKVLISESEGEESEVQGRKFQDIDDDPLVSLVREFMKEKPTDFVTPTKASGEAQEDKISPTVLEAAKTLSKVASQGVSKEKSTDKGKRYRRRARSIAKKIDIGLDTEEEVNTGKEEVNTGIEEVSTGSTKVDSGTASKRGQREGKAPMVEEDIQATHKTKEQLRQVEAGLEEAIKLQAQLDEEVAKQIHFDKMFYTEEDWDAIKAKLEANAELSKDVLGQDLPEQDFAKRMVDMVNQRKKHFAEERAKEKRNKPMTQSQLRIYMSNYLKNQGTWKLSQLKKLKFEEIKEEFDKLVQQIDTFVPINLEATKAKLKRYGEELQTKTSKKQKIDDKDVPAIGEKVAEVKEEEQVKRTGKRKKQKARKGINVDKSAQEDSETDKEESIEAMNPTPLTTKSDSVANWKIFQQGQRSVYQIIRANGADTVYMSFGAMIKDFTREDLIELYRLVMQKYGTNRPEDAYDRVLWSDLRTMFDPPLIEDAIWSLPLQQKMVSWRYYDKCEVHCLTLEACTIYMLADRKYPLSKEACQVMLKMKLLDGKMNEVCYKLLKILKDDEKPSLGLEVI
ncbi:hypothetical protein Tco_0540141, partial [Tanacetum coccineum]